MDEVVSARVSFDVHVKKHPLRDMVALLKKRAWAERFFLNVKVGLIVWRSCGENDVASLHPCTVERTITIPPDSVGRWRDANVLAVHFDSSAGRIGVNGDFEWGK